MINQFQKDKKIRKLFSKKELTDFVLKNLVQNSNLSVIIKWNAILQMSNLTKNQNKTKFVNRCILTARKAKFNKNFKNFSRLSFLKLARSGTINGVKKASW